MQQPIPAVFGFFVFASAGLPGLSGFVGEFLSLVGAFAANPWFAAVAAFVMILGAGYLLWMFQRVALVQAWTSRTLPIAPSQMISQVWRMKSPE